MLSVLYYIDIFKSKIKLQDVDQIVNKTNCNFKISTKDKSDPFYLDSYALADSFKYFIHKTAVPDDLDSRQNSIKSHFIRQLNYHKPK